MGHTILNVLGVILLLALMGASVAIRLKLSMKCQELVKKAREEPGNKQNTAVIYKMIWDTLKMK